MVPNAHRPTPLGGILDFFEDVVELGKEGLRLVRVQAEAARDGVEWVAEQLGGGSSRSSSGRYYLLITECGAIKVPESITSRPDWPQVAGEMERACRERRAMLARVAQAVRTYGARSDVLSRALSAAGSFVSPGEAAALLARPDVQMAVAAEQARAAAELAAAKRRAIQIALERQKKSGNKLLKVAALAGAGYLGAKAFGVL